MPNDAVPDRRRYTMGARAAAVEATHRRTMEAVMELADDRFISAITLNDVAELAGVSVQTVLRHFGSRAALIDATVAHATAIYVTERAAPVGDLRAAVRAIVGHYEERGDSVLLLLAQEGLDPQVATMTERGRRVHRAWVQEVFAPFEPTPSTVDLLVVATDVYAWKLLRRDRSLSRRQTESRMRALVAAVLAAAGKDGP